MAETAPTNAVAGTPLVAHFDVKGEAWDEHGFEITTLWGLACEHDFSKGRPGPEVKPSIESVKKYFINVFLASHTNGDVRMATEVFKTEYDTAIRHRGRLYFENFIFFMKRIHKRYGSFGQVPLHHYLYNLMICISADQGQGKIALVPPEKVQKIRNAIPVREYYAVMDSVDSEEEVEDERRIIILGPPMLGKSTHGRAIAQSTGTQHISIYDLALAAIDRPDDKKGLEILQCIHDQKPVPLALQASLVSQALKDPATVHKGFVFDEFPHCGEKDGKYIEFMNMIGMENLPTSVVVLECGADVDDVLCTTATERVQKWNEELAFRDKQKADAEEAIKAKAEKEQNKQAMLERRAKIEAGELEATPADSEPIPEDPPELDEEGNPLTDEAREAKIVQERAKETRRRLLIDLDHYLSEGRTFVTAGPYYNPLECRFFAPWISRAKLQNRYLTFFYKDKPEKIAQYVSALLDFPGTVPVASLFPKEEGQELPTEEAEAEAYLGTLRAKYDFSSWGRYCPVTFNENGVLLEGKPQYGCIYKGKIYLLASPKRQEWFMKCPKQFLQRLRPTGPRKCMVLGATLDAFISAGFSENDFVHDLSQTWQLHRISAKEYYHKYVELVELKKKQAEEEELRKKAEEEARIEEEKRKAAEKKRQAAADKKKTDAAPAPSDKKKKKTDEEEKAEEKPPEEEVKEAPPPPTADEIVNAKVAELEKLLQDSQPILLYQLAELKVDELNWLKDNKFLPETCILIEHILPVVENAEDADAAAPVEPDPEGGEPKPVVIDLTDPAHYKDFMIKYVEAIQTKTEEAEGNATQGANTIVNVRRFNTYMVSAVDLKLQVVQDLDKCVFPIDTETKIPDDPAAEETEGPKKDPRLIPGKRSIHYFGRALHYCPVTLNLTNLLVAGNPEFTARYRGRFYYFRSEVELTAFKKNPTKYIPYYPAHVPPPRIWILGPHGSGKTTMAQTLALERGIPILYSDPGRLRGIATNSFGPDADKAREIITQIDDFETNQENKKQEKEERIRRNTEREEKIANGEDVDDEEEIPGSEAILEWEPEEEETRNERLLKAWTKVLSHVMKCAPYDTQGFLLLGSPDSEAQLELMISLNLIPELVVNVTITPETYIKRTMPSVLEAKRRVRADKMKEIDEKKKSKLQIQRRVELMRWRQRNIGGAEAEDNGEELEEPEEITEEAVQSELEGQFDTQNSKIQAVAAALPDKRIKVYTVSADRARGALLRSIYEDLASHLLQRESLFDNPYVVTYGEAIEMLSKGTIQVSSFGTRDPVSLASWKRSLPPSLAFRPTKEICDPTDVPDGTERLPPPAPKPKTDDDEPPEPPAKDEEEDEPMSPEELETLEKAAKDKALAEEIDSLPRCAIMHNRVYFFSNNTTLLDFMTAPTRYVTQPEPIPRLPVGLLVLNNNLQKQEKEKIRTLGQHIAHNTNCVHINVKSLVKWALQSDLPEANTISKCLLAKKPIDDKIIVSILKCRTLCGDAVMNGFVVDDFPCTTQQAEAVNHSGIQFSKVLITREFATPQRRELIHYYQTDSCCVHEIKSDKATTFSDLVEGYTALQANNLRRQILAQRRGYGLPALLWDCSVKTKDYVRSWSSFGVYCPTEWLRNSLLVDSSEIDPNRQFSVEFCGVVYNFCKAQWAEEFIQNPYPILQEGRGLPRSLPTKVPLAEASRKQLTDFELLGCCPVTLYDTRLRTGLRGTYEPLAVYGNNSFTVEYDFKFYRMVDKTAQGRFLQQPWVFIQGAVLPHPDKLPASDDGTIEMNTERYLQSTVYETVSRGMLAVGALRPKLPNRNVMDSALKYLALHMKANNPTNTPYCSERYSDNMQFFLECCSLYDVVSKPPPPEADESVKEKYQSDCAKWDKFCSLSPDLHEFINLEKF
eukprot:PhF_6_TR25543/c0_g1_i1/m.35846/K18533/AK9; adenylate/nucleoside-diphosphate kinase